MIQIFLFIGGVIAIVKGEFRATKTRNVSVKAARIIGIIFILSATLPLIIPRPYGMIIMLAIALITAIVGVITAKESTPDRKEENKAA